MPRRLLRAQLSQTATRFQGLRGLFVRRRLSTLAPRRNRHRHHRRPRVAVALDRRTLSSLEGLSPGMLSGKFTVKVFAKKSGDFSVDQQVATVSPYDTYFVGVAAEEATGATNTSTAGREHIIKVSDARRQRASPNPAAKRARIGLQNGFLLVVGRLSAQFGRTSPKMRSTPNYKTLRATLSNGTGQATMRWSTGDYGYYMIRVTSPEPGTRRPGSYALLVRLAGRRHFGDGCRHAARPHRDR